ncbi:MAG: hypothetical protein ACI9OJ_005865 [Myxococcota bacterium]|jgi:hypothetical protein
MANSVPRIVQGGFSVDRGLDDHPVYFLTVGGVPIVVKGEAKGSVGHERTDQEAAISIKWGSKLMKNVNDRLVNTKLMDQSEVTAFLTVAKSKFKPLPTIPGAPPGPPPPNRYRNVTPQGAQQYTWVKMPAVAGLSDAEFTKKVGGFTTPVRGKVKEQIVKFTDESLWPQLGKVLAVDIFNGNSDRFDIASGRWINYGNVMFIDQGSKVIGLDTFDPNTKQSNLVAHGRFDELKILTDTLKQKQFALACATSVGETLEFDAFTKGQDYVTLPVEGPDGRVLWRVNRGEVKELYTPFAPAMAAGIAKGANELKAYLQRKVTQYRQKALAQAPRRPLPPTPGRVRPRATGAPPPRPNAVRLHAAPIPGMPQGILDRMHYLGWLQ